MNEKVNDVSNSLQFDYTKFIPPFAASVAIVPSFYWFARKGALQSNSPVPSFNFNNTFLAGIKSVPIIAGTVGLQLILQEAFEKTLKNKSLMSDWQSSLSASSLVGFFTAIPLGIFQGQTLGLSIQDSIKTSLTPKLISVIGLRESGFIAGLQLGKPVAKLLNPQNDNLLIKNLTYFTTSAGAALLTQPLDSLATRSFKQTTNSASLYAGSISRAIASGIFSIVYQNVKTFISSNLNSEKTI